MGRTRSEAVPAGSLGVLALVVGLSITLSGCGSSGSTAASSAPSSAPAATCSDSGYTQAVVPRLLSLNKALIRVDAGHDDVALLGAAAPGLVSAADSVLTTARTKTPCSPELVHADAQLLATTKKLSLAGHALAQLTAAAKQGKDFSGLQSQFLSSYYSGTSDFQASLAALRSAGVPPLLTAASGRAVFLKAGCASCHALAAAKARGTAGPDLDQVRPSKTAVVSAVTNGQGVMPSFGGTLTADQIQAVADFVSQSAGR